MAVKKSELYSSLWAGCDELGGSMDVSQYKDYGSVMLFMKYVSDDDKGKISKNTLAKTVKELDKRNDENTDEFDMLQKYKKLMDEEADIKAQITKALDELAERNESPLPKQTDSVTDITAKVEGHLKKMRLAWK